jgi:hypothetical protein
VLVALSAVMGLSIFLSMPIVFRKAMSSRTITLLNSAAIGILVFLLADLFLDVGRRSTAIRPVRSSRTPVTRRCSP